MKMLIKSKFKAYCSIVNILIVFHFFSCQKNPYFNMRRTTISRSYPIPCDHDYVKYHINCKELQKKYPNIKMDELDFIDYVDSYDIYEKKQWEKTKLKIKYKRGRRKKFEYNIIKLKEDVSCRLVYTTLKNTYIISNIENALYRSIFNFFTDKNLNNIFIPYDLSKIIIKYFLNNKDELIFFIPFNIMDILFSNMAHNYKNDYFNKCKYDFSINLRKINAINPLFIGIIPPSIILDTKKCLKIEKNHSDKNKFLLEEIKKIKKNISFYIKHLYDIINWNRYSPKIKNDVIIKPFLENFLIFVKYFENNSVIYNNNDLIRENCFSKIEYNIIKSCSFCGVPEENISKCYRCKDDNYNYCSIFCQIEDWIEHKKKCICHICKNIGICKCQNKPLSTIKHEYVFFHKYAYIEYSLFLIIILSIFFYIRS